MLRAAPFAVLLALLLLLPAHGGAADEAGPVDGFTFGGMEVLANTSGAANASVADLPSVIEFYTASWCTNCLEAKDRLHEALETREGVELHYHRHENEVQDPFGTPEGDERFDRKDPPYGLAPPITLIHGHQMKQGSADDDLTARYGTMLDSTTGAPTTGSSSLTWTTNDGRNGTVDWALVGDENWPAGDDAPVVTSVLIVIEEVIAFEGSNGAETQERVVRQVIELDGDAGSLALELQAPEDGDDLSLVLVHDVVLPTKTSEDTPAPGVVVGVVALLAAALLLRRDD